MNRPDAFGAKIKSARLEKKLTQKALANIVDAKHNSVSDWERGYSMPDPDTIVRLCEVLELSPSYLLLQDESIKSERLKEVLYISRPSGNLKSDEIRRYLHEAIDQLPDDSLEFFKDFTLRMIK